MERYRHYSISKPCLTNSSGLETKQLLTARLSRWESCPVLWCCEDADHESHGLRPVYPEPWAGWLLSGVKFLPLTTLMLPRWRGSPVPHSSAPWLVCCPGSRDLWCWRRCRSAADKHKWPPGAALPSHKWQSRDSSGQSPTWEGARGEMLANCWDETLRFTYNQWEMGSSSWICECLGGAVLLSPWAYWFWAHQFPLEADVCKWIFPPDSSLSGLLNSASLPLTPLSAVGLFVSLIKTDLSADHPARPFPARERRHPHPSVFQLHWLQQLLEAPEQGYKAVNKVSEKDLNEEGWRDGHFFLKDKQAASIFSFLQSVSEEHVVCNYRHSWMQWGTGAITVQPLSTRRLSCLSHPAIDLLSLLFRTVIQISIPIPWIFYLSPSPGLSIMLSGPNKTSQKYVCWAILFHSAGGSCWATYSFEAFLLKLLCHFSEMN